MIDDLDAYGLTKEDFMENMKELQMVLEGDKTLSGNLLPRHSNMAVLYFHPHCYNPSIHCLYFLQTILLASTLG